LRSLLSKDKLPVEIGDLAGEYCDNISILTDDEEEASATKTTKSTAVSTKMSFYPQGIEVGWEKVGNLWIRKCPWRLLFPLIVVLIGALLCSFPRTCSLRYRPS